MTAGSFTALAPDDLPHDLSDLEPGCLDVLAPPLLLGAVGRGKKAILWRCIVWATPCYYLVYRKVIHCTD